MHTDYADKTISEGLTEGGCITQLGNEQGPGLPPKISAVDVGVALFVSGVNADEAMALNARDWK